MTAALTPGEQWRLGYRPALDGLRGIAVLLVMGYHFFVPGMPGGGHVGVTIFFVLSGFLITALLLEERERNGAIQLGAFYLRRGRRLLPALFALIAVVMVLATGRGRADEVLPNAAATALYVANLAQLGDPISLEHLSHAWSLAVEEQFYLVWPLALIVTLKLLGVMGPALIAISLAAAAFAARLTSIDLAGLDRIDGIMVGCLAAIAAVNGWLPRIGWLPALAGITVLSVLTTIPIGGSGSAWALAAVALASVAVIGYVAGPFERSPLIAMLASRPLVALGSISYGLYLWHFAVGWELWPHLNRAGWHWLPAALLMFAVSITLAGLSYRLIERPLTQRRGTRREVAESSRRLRSPRSVGSPASPTRADPPGRAPR